MDRGNRFNAEGYYDDTPYQAIRNIDSEERYRAGNNGQDKFDTTPPKHQKRTPEQIVAHNAKRAAKRATRKAAREAAGIIPAYRQNLNKES